LEWWNIGKMGLGILQYWVNGEIGLDLKVGIDKFLKNPLFHYSRIEANTNASENTRFI
jgi:hypothetical protein